MKKVFFITIVISIISITGCNFGNSWSSFYYPHNDPEDQNVIINYNAFNSKEDCLNSLETVKGARAYRYDSSLDSYECGHICSYETDEFYTCEETVD